MTATVSPLLAKIRDAYADAGRTQPADYPALPAWFDLPLELREAIIHVAVSSNTVDAAQRRDEKDRLTA